MAASGSSRRRGRDGHAAISAKGAGEDRLTSSVSVSYDNLYSRALAALTPERRGPKETRKPTLRQFSWEWE